MTSLDSINGVGKLGLFLLENLVRFVEIFSSKEKMTSLDSINGVGKLGLFLLEVIHWKSTLLKIQMDWKTIFLCKGHYLLS